jgi:hypothetical protein
MAKIKEDLNWQEVDPDTLQAPVASAFAAYKEAYATAKEFRDEFERLASETAALPETHRLAFGYNFGKLSIAVAKAKPKSSAGSKAVAFDKIKVA